jgi:hypothetical protein
MERERKRGTRRRAVMMSGMTPMRIKLLVDRESREGGKGRETTGAVL